MNRQSQLWLLMSVPLFLSFAACVGTQTVISQQSTQQQVPDAKLARPLDAGALAELITAADSLELLSRASKTPLPKGEPFNTAIRAVAGLASKRFSSNVDFDKFCDRWIPAAGTATEPGHAAARRFVYATVDLINASEGTLDSSMLAVVAFEAAIHEFLPAGVAVLRTAEPRRNADRASSLLSADEVAAMHPHPGDRRARFRLDGSIGIITLGLIDRSAVRACASQFQDWLNDGRFPTSLLIDLRSAFGHSVQDGSSFANIFIEHGTIATARGWRGLKTRQAEPLEYVSLTANLPIVVVVSPATAGMAEVIALALQHHRSAKLAGTRTSGEGQIVVFHRAPGNYILGVPEAHFERIGGGSLAGGIVPDICRSSNGTWQLTVDGNTEDCAPLDDENVVTLTKVLGMQLDAPCHEKLDLPAPLNRANGRCTCGLLDAFCRSEVGPARPCACHREGALC